MMVEKRILEAIDACRPGSDDLDQLKQEQPELAEAAAQVAEDPQLVKLHQQIQNFDAKLVEVIEDVPVPVGLAERLMTRLEAAAKDQDSGDQAAGDQAAGDQAAEEAASPVTALDHSVSTHSSLLNRRVALGVGAAIAASLLVAFSFGLLGPAQQEISHANIESIAQAWYDQITELDDWRSEPAPSTYQPSRFVIAQPRRWQRFDCSADGQTVVYDLTKPGSEHRATLIVVRAATSGLPTAPSTHPIWTQGRSVAAWQEGGLLYVLVIEGPEHHYRRYVDTKTGPVA